MKPHFFRIVTNDIGRNEKKVRVAHNEIKMFKKTVKKIYF